MATATREPELVEREVAPSLPAQVGGNVDTQVSTAKRFPRSIEAFMRRASEMATLTPDIAASCVYAVPRDGKMIEGPSARLAEIVANAWGNLRIQAGADADAEQDSHFILGYGEAWDVEANVAIRFEVRRRITTKKGGRFNDDMVVVTGNAAASIALRNAVFKAVPSSFWRPIYQQCRQVIAGKAETFAKRRDEMLKAFNVMGVTNEQLYGALGVKGLADITLDHMVQITGVFNALKEGEITVEEAFPEGGGLGSPQPSQRKSQQADKSAAAGHAEAPRAAVQASGSGEPRNIGEITAVRESTGGGALLILDTGFKAATRDAELMTAAAGHRDAKRRVELVTRPSSDPSKFAPVLEEIRPVEAPVA